jgi:hypothetical protein
VQASIKRYDQHILMATSTPAASWQRMLEAAVPPAGANADADAMAQYALLAGALQKSPLSSALGAIPPRITLFQTGSGDALPLGDGDMLFFSTTEPPALIRSSQAATAPTAAAVPVFDLASGKGRTDTKQHPLLQRLLQLRGVNADAVTSASLEASVLPSSAVAADESSYHLVALVCCHTQRDARCGDRGPPLLAAIRAWAAARTAAAEGLESIAPPVHVHAYPCSHVGGHEFAGNVLLYGWRRGPQPTGAAAPVPVVNDWFGLVAPGAVPTLLDAYATFLADAAAQPQDRQAEVAALRAKLLAHPLSAAAGAAGGCSTCEPTSDPTAVPTKLADLWRGAMGVEKDEARALLQRIKA